MIKPNLTVQPALSSFEKRIGELRSQLTNSDPHILADRTGARFITTKDGDGEFQLELWGNPVLLSFPGFHAASSVSREALPAFNTALLLYYFITADGSPPEERWISFADLPGGRFYAQAFQGYSGDELSRRFQNDCESFKRAAEKIGGLPFSLGDASFIFKALPRITILVVFWQGDEDFSPSYKFLFNASAPHYLPTDAYAILGSNITRRLIASR